MHSLVVLGVALLVLIATLSRKKRRLPPGPRRLPLLGNALDLPVNNVWLQFSRWREQYGSLIYIEILSQPAVIISSHKVAVDLMSHRARVYSDRPWNFVAKELLLGGRFMPFMDYNDRFRRLRRAAQEGFRKASLPKYREIQTTEAVRVVKSLMIPGTAWEECLETNAASSIMSSVYGFPVADDKDPDVQSIRQHTERIGRAIYPGAYLVDALPWLRFLPAQLSPWHRDTRGFYAQDDALFHRLFRSAGSSYNVDSELTTFARIIAEKVDEGLLDEPDAAWLCATLFAAGVETTTASLTWFIVSMVTHSDVQAKAHDELDRIVGRNRLPSFDDKDRLTYLNAIIHEVLRWRPPLPIGLPHCLATDDVYHGFDIPRGTICIPNVWEMNRDPEVWGADAEMFRPERHLDEQGNLRPRPLSGQDDYHASFGFGNRVCPGKHFAGDTMFITCATILWTFKITPLRDADTTTISGAEYASTGSPLTIHPAAFPCSFTARFPGATQHIATEQKDPDAV